jgi:hypothetical protein
MRGVTKALPIGGAFAVSFLKNAGGPGGSVTDKTFIGAKYTGSEHKGRPGSYIEEVPN